MWWLYVPVAVGGALALRRNRKRRRATPAQKRSDLKLTAAAEGFPVSVQEVSGDHARVRALPSPTTPLDLVGRDYWVPADTNVRIQPVMVAICTRCAREGESGCIEWENYPC